MCALSRRCCVFSLSVFWRSLILRFNLLEVVFFNQESLLFGCCSPWARGDITTANWQCSGPTAGRSSCGSEMESRHRTSRHSRFVDVLQVPSPVGGLGFAADPAPLAVASVPFRLSSCLVRLLSSASSTIRSFDVVRRRSAGAEVGIGDLDRNRGISLQPPSRSLGRAVVSP